MTKDIERRLKALEAINPGRGAAVYEVTFDDGTVKRMDTYDACHLLMSGRDDIVAAELVEPNPSSSGLLGVIVEAMLAPAEPERPEPPPQEPVYDNVPSIAEEPQKEPEADVPLPEAEPIKQRGVWPCW